MNLKKTNISAILNSVTIAISIAHSQALFPESWEKWIVYLITLAGTFGIAGTTVGLGHKAIKGEAIISEEPKPVMKIGK